MIEMMSRYLVLIVVSVLVAGFLARCSTTSNAGGIGKSIPQTIEQACNFYTTTRPQVVAYRDYAVKNWDAKVPGTDQPLIPDAQKALLFQLDAHLKELDALGVDVCAINSALKAATTSGKGFGASLSATLKNVDWDTVLSGVLKVATTYEQLHVQGTL